jgi:glyoxylase-like metal-dependent hydrolase (beta-lactamase superfamily II)
MEALRRDHGVERIEAAVVTHYHDDHVAGLNLLREVEGTEVWAPADVAPVLEDPRRYDVPCLWPDPIRVDRSLAPRQPVGWHEYTLTTYPLPGHTLYAAAIAFEVDGRRVLATGDQQSFEEGGRNTLNYQYRNRFRIDDFVASAELYLELRPELMLTGHWGAQEVDEALFRRLLEAGRRLASLHRELLPGEDAEGFPARIEPYRSTVRSGGEVQLDVLVRSPFARPEQAVVELVVPEGWAAEPARLELELPERGEACARFAVRAGAPGRRARVAADVTIGGTRFGPQAEALVDVE